MKILLLGAGGREHALAWKMKQSPLTQSIFIAPGNPGTATIGTNVNIAATDFAALAAFAKKENITMIIAGPEEPLVKGAQDFFAADETLKDVIFIGPSAYGAQLEGSKAFAKAFMERHAIPTAAYREFTADSLEEGKAYILQHELPIVLKADGLAAGKGVIISETHADALAAFEEMIVAAKFGDAGKKVVIEAFLSGIELSVFVLTDGKEYIVLPEAKDYKRIGEKDSGLNTGGMGAVSPVPFADAAFMQKVEDRVIKPTVNGLAKENITYTGFIFIGLIKVNNEPYVIEYNCRMGDPETEVVLPRLKNDLVSLFIAAGKNQLTGISIQTDERAASTVVAVSKGYPGDIEKGFPITGLDGDYGVDTIVFQAGTQEKEGNIINSGGRVFTVTSFADDISSAVKKSNEIIEKISFEGKNYRRDIGYEFQ